jgi:methyl-accepting chemotaxis protein
MSKDTNNSLKHKIGIKYTVDILLLFVMMAGILFSSAYFKTERTYSLIITFLLVVYVIQYEFSKKWIDNAIKHVIDTNADNTDQKTRFITNVEQKQKTHIENALETVKLGYNDVNNLKITIEQNKNTSNAVYVKTKQVLDFSEAEQLAVKENSDNMLNLKQKIQQIAELILELSDHAQQIGMTIGLVEDLAEQTNMLALNASVEAARAGEHGKGFAVVAGEIRKLADESKQATSKISILIKDIQMATSSTVMATEEGSKELEEGSKFAEKMIEDVDSIKNLLITINTTAKDIFDNANSQVTISDSLNQKCFSLEEDIQKALISVNENIENVEGINYLSKTLKEEVINR